MISLAHPFVLTDRPEFLLFADAKDTGVIHVLALGLLPGDAGLTLMGRGKRSDAGLLAGFWTLTLRGALTDADRLAISASLTGEGAAPIRVLAAEAEIVMRLTLTDAPLIGGEAQAKGWRGGPLSLSGEVGPMAAGALRRAWEVGLPQARAEMDLLVTGIGAATAARSSAQNLTFDMRDPSQARLHLQSASLATNREQATSLRLTIPARLTFAPAALTQRIIYAGFDP